MTPDPAKADARPFLQTRSSLLTRLRDSGDARAWRRFHDDYGALIFQVCRRTGLQPQEAEDVVQETFAAVAQQMPKFEYDRSKGTFKAWLARVTKNHIADFLEKKSRRARHVVAAALAEAGPEAAAPPDLDHVWESEWRDHLMARALRRAQENVSMPNIQIFQLIALHGWSPEEIVRSLGVSRARVYLAKHRVGRLVAREIAALRRELEE